MQERLHEHINLELHTNTTTDTTFILAAIVFNFVMLCIGSTAAAGASDQGPVELGSASIVIYIITLILTLVVNGIAVIGLITGRGTRKLLSSGLLKMYQDAEVSAYYDAALLTNYERRYVLFIGIVCVIGLAAAAIPLVILVFMR
jgi:hypothetical protein